MSEANQTTSGNEKKTKVLAFIVLALGLIGSAIILVTGLDLTDLRSVGGESVAEAYYQSMGKAMIGLSFFTAAITSYCFIKLKSTK